MSLSEDRQGTTAAITRLLSQVPDFIDRAGPSLVVGPRWRSGNCLAV